MDALLVSFTVLGVLVAMIGLGFGLGYLAQRVAERTLEPSQSSPSERDSAPESRSR